MSMDENLEAKHIRSVLADYVYELNVHQDECFEEANKILKHLDYAGYKVCKKEKN